MAKIFLRSFIYNMITFSPNFTAKPISKTDIKKFNINKNSYQGCNVSFVQFDPKNYNDVFALQDIARNWEGQLFAGTIWRKALEIRKGIVPDKENAIYILTSQMNNFEKLISDKILGVTHVNTSDSKYTTIKLLQVDPKNKYGCSNRQFKDIGKVIIKSIQEYYNTGIKLKAYFAAVDFYLSQGFKLSNPEKLEFILKKKS